MKELPQRALPETERQDNQIKIGIGRKKGEEEQLIMLESHLGKLLFDVGETEQIIYAFQECIKMIRLGVKGPKGIQ